jgi:hypothetical protein
MVGEIQYVHPKSAPTPYVSWPHPEMPASSVTFPFISSNSVSACLSIPLFSITYLCVAPQITMPCCKSEWFSKTNLSVSYRLSVGPVISELAHPAVRKVGYIAGGPLSPGCAETSPFPIDLILISWYNAFGSGPLH